MSDNNYKQRRRLGWLIISIILLALAGFLLYGRKSVPGFANFYTNHIYPLWQGSLGRFAGLLPFSLSEVLLYSMPVIILIDVISIIASKRNARKTHKPISMNSVDNKTIKRSGRKFSGLLKRIIVLVSLLAFLYSANCGVNYYAESFVSRENVPLIRIHMDTNAIDNTEANANAGMETTSLSESQMEELLIEFCEYVADSLNQDSADYPSGNELAELAVDSMKNLGEKYSSLSGYYSKPKAMLNSRPFSHMGVTGIYSPFTIEANYNREITPYNLPFTACHELSHLKGYMDEGEANYIGWLACIYSRDVAFNRSGYMMAWVYAGNELYRVNREEFNRIRRTLSTDTIQELQDNNDFWDKYETKASEVQDQINDAYLQYNGLEAGIRSYDEIVLLMLSWYNEIKTEEL